MKIAEMRLLLIICLIFFVSSCSVTTNIPKPNESYRVAEVALPVSTVAIPVSFSKTNLLAEINSRLDGLIYEDMNLSDDNFQVKVWKTKPISMDFEGSNIHYSVPIKIWLNGSIGILGFSVSSVMEAEMAMRFTTSFTFSKDWNLKPKTTLTGYEWVKEPVATVGRMKFPVSFIADKAISNSRGDICTSIDKNLLEGLNLGSVVNQITASVRRPFLINSDYNIWLVLVPQKISISPFTSSDTTITTIFGLKTVSEVIVGNKMPELWLDAPKPELVLGNGTDRFLNISFGIDIPFSEAEVLFSKEVVGKTFSKGRRAVKVDSLRIFGSGDKVVIGAQLSGSLSGWIYFKGITTYNKATRSVEFLNLDYELETRNVLHRSASWLFRSSILNSLKEAMVFPVGPELDRTLKDINSNLVQNKNIKNLELNGKISELVIDQIHLIPESFRVTVKAKGEISVFVNNLN